MIHILENDNFKVEINSKGAELVGFTKISNQKNYIWSGDAQFWNKHSPILFPIVGTLKNNEYYYNNKSYSLNRHGFARDLNFEVIDESKNTITFRLQSDSESKKIYPFDFVLDLKYQLSDNQLLFGYTVCNSGRNKLLFSIGAHPAFSLSNNFENYSLQFNKDSVLEHYPLLDNLLSETSKKLNLEENSLPLSYQLFEDDALVMKQLQSDSITILENKKPLVQISWSNFKNLGIWTIKNAPFICIEPWLGFSSSVNSSDQLSEKEGIFCLPSNEKFQANMQITILD